MTLVRVEKLLSMHMYANACVKQFVIPCYNAIKNQ